MAVPARWAWATLVAAAERASAGGGAVPAELGQWIERLGTPAPEPAPIHARLPPAAAEDPARLEGSASLLALPELAGWFLDPASVSSESLEWLQARESRLVISEQIKAERLAALVDRIIETRFDAPTRRPLAGAARGPGLRPPRARARDGRRGAQSRSRARSRTRTATLRRIPFLRALVERSLEVAGEVATGRLSAETASRAPRAHAAPARGG